MKDGRSRRPLQFDLRTMLLVTAALALVFAVLKWLGVPPQASLLVLVVLGVSVIAAIGLVVVIAGSAADQGGDSQRSMGPPRQRQEKSGRRGPDEPTDPTE